MSRFFLVEVGDDDELRALYTTRHGVWTSIKLVNGVKSLCDLRAIDMGTLASILLAGDAELRIVMAVDEKRKQTSPDHVIRAYWRRVRQPGLGM